MRGAIGAKIVDALRDAELAGGTCIAKRGVDPEK